MSSLPHVSVVVPHYHDLAGLDACLTALTAQTFPADRFEIIVADNNSPEGADAVAQAIAGRARLTVVTEKGAGPARNGGVAAARGEILAFTDSDCVPEPEWLAAGVAALQHCDFAGGAMSVLVSDPAHPTPTEAFELVFAFNNQAYVRDKGFTVTANLFCTRKLFDEVGGFRVGVSEDVEWCQRATRAGYRIGYAADARVGHPARRDWPELERKWRRMAHEGFLLALEARHGRLTWLVKALAMPVSAVAHTPKVLASPALRTWSARRGALEVLYRSRFWRFRENLRLLASPQP
jgi:glycosyltransferase involved in cell wall biosynthesis